MNLNQYLVILRVILERSSMDKLEKEKLENVTGGGISVWGIFGIIAAVVFIVGVIDGISRPVKCG